MTLRHRIANASTSLFPGFDVHPEKPAGRFVEELSRNDQPLLISATVRERLPEGFVVRELAAQSPHGRRAAVQLYAVDGVADPQT